MVRRPHPHPAPALPTRIRYEVLAAALKVSHDRHVPMQGEPGGALSLKEISEPGRGGHRKEGCTARAVSKSLPQVETWTGPGPHGMKMYHRSG
jgi:hypothetical protein